MKFHLYFFSFPLAYISKNFLYSMIRSYKNCLKQRTDFPSRFFNNHLLKILHFYHLSFKLLRYLIFYLSVFLGRIMEYQQLMARYLIYDTYFFLMLYIFVTVHLNYKLDWNSNLNNYSFDFFDDYYFSYWLNLRLLYL